MQADINPIAIPYLPNFVTAPGESDGLLTFMTVFLIVVILSMGVLVLRIHTLPERKLHKSNKLQLEIVSVLGLLALLTHVHVFWVIGLLLAFVDIPDFSTPIARIARALERLASRHGAEEQPEPQALPVLEHRHPAQLPHPEG
jgi:hypothetical protein